MPGMNVRGDQHLNFTRDEAADWLGRVDIPQYAPGTPDPGAHGGDVIGGVLGVMTLLVVLAFFYAAFSGSTQRRSASSDSGTSMQRQAVIRQMPTAVESQQEVTSENLSAPMVTLQYVPSPPSATSEYIASPISYMPAGWFYGRMQGALPLRNKEGRSMGAVPDGATFFATTEESSAQIIVSADGSYWGFAEIKLPENLATPPIPVTPAFKNAAERIRAIEAFGITNALYMYNRQAPEEAYLPAGWSMGDLAQDQPLTNGVNGARIGTIKQGTRLLFQIANVNDWRLVVSADGSSFGYACIRSLRNAPERTPMRPECRAGVALIHRLEHGSGVPEGDGIRQALAENSSTPTMYGEEQ